MSMRLGHPNLQLPAYAGSSCLPMQNRGACQCRVQVPVHAGPRGLAMQSPGACLCRGPKIQNVLGQFVPINRAMAHGGHSNWGLSHGLPKCSC